MIKTFSRFDSKKQQFAHNILNNILNKNYSKVTASDENNDSNRNRNEGNQSKRKNEIIHNRQKYLSPSLKTFEAYQEPFIIERGYMQNIWLDEDEPVSVTGYVNHPKPSDLQKKRRKWKKEIDKMNDFIYRVSAKMTDTSLEEVRKKNKSPFVFNGFLPQVTAPDPTNGGLPVENGVVDENGKPFEKNS